MIHRFDRVSFVLGAVIATTLACAIGAASHFDEPVVRRFDVTPVIGGMGPQIVDHQRNTVYNYKREKRELGAAYNLYETIDLAQVGKKRIVAETTEKKPD